MADVKRNDNLIRRLRSANRKRTALTLLELVLALSLTVLLLMSIAMAINMHFRMLELRRTNVEEAVEVRSIVNNLFAKDLQGVSLFEPPDLSGLEALGGNTAGAAASLLGSAASDPNLAALAGQVAGGGTGGGQQPSGQQGGNQAAGGTTQTAPTGASQTGGNQAGGTSQPSAASGSKTGGTNTPSSLPSGATAGSPQSTAAGSSASPTGEEASTAPAAPTMGLYGSATELKFDVSRLPRLEEYEGLMASDDVTATTVPTDVKTIIYFLAGEDMPPDPRVIGPQDVLPSTTGIGRGLMRREIDRAANAYAEANGDLDSIYAGSRLVSDKITGLAFQYFDGTAWVTDWDSDAMGGLPQAVEIVLTIEPTYGMTEAEIADLETEPPPPRTYRHVVKIPTARLAPPATTEDAAATDAAAGTTPGGAAGSTSSPSGQGATP